MLRSIGFSFLEEWELSGREAADRNDEQRPATCDEGKIGQNPVRTSTSRIEKSIRQRQGADVFCAYLGDKEPVKVFA
jgi:hypothetical protein